MLTCNSCSNPFSLSIDNASLSIGLHCDLCNHTEDHTLTASQILSLDLSPPHERLRRVECFLTLNKMSERTPKITHLSIDWYPEYGNRPRLCVHVDAPYPTNPWARIFHTTKVLAPGETFVYATHGDRCHYFHHSSRNQTGYSGAVFTVLTNLGQQSFRGPWSSRAGVYNSLHLPGGPCVDCALIEPGSSTPSHAAFLLSSLIPHLGSPILATSNSNSNFQSPSGTLSLSCNLDEKYDTDITFEPCVRLPSNTLWFKGNPLPQESLS